MDGLFSFIDGDNLTVEILHPTLISELAARYGMSSATAFTSVFTLKGEIISVFAFTCSCFTFGIW